MINNIIPALTPHGSPGYHLLSAPGSLQAGRCKGLFSGHRLCFRHFCMFHCILTTSKQVVWIPQCILEPLRQLKFREAPDTQGGGRNCTQSLSPQAQIPHTPLQPGEEASLLPSREDSLGSDLVLLSVLIPFPKQRVGADRQMQRPRVPRLSE